MKITGVETPDFQKLILCERLPRLQLPHVGRTAPRGAPGRYGRLVRRAALLVLVIGLLAGCGASVAGEPVAAGTSRPRDIRLDSIDPCSLFTPQVKAKLGLDRSNRYDRSSSPIFQGEVPACGVTRSARPAVAVSVSFALLDGIELFQPERVRGTLDPLAIQGFPSLLLTPSKAQDNCGVIIDVAPGQVLAVLYADGGHKPPIAQPQLCAGAMQTADLVMAALLAQV